MRTRGTFLVLLILLCSASLFGQQRDQPVGVILLNPDLKFILNEPTGWVLDTQTAQQHGLDAVLYPKGSSWKDAVAVMYALVIHKDETKRTIEKVIADDIADFMKASKESTVGDSPAVKTRGGKDAIVKVFYDAANKNYESVAFIDNDKVVVILTLSSRSKSEYEKSLPAFKELVTSFFPFTLSTRP